MSQPGTFRQVSVADALRIAGDRRIIDVRELVEWNEGHIPSATLVPLADIPTQISDAVREAVTLFSG